MNRITSRFFSVALGGFALIGVSSVAHADMLFHNITDETLYFGLSCNGSGIDQWAIAAHDTRSIVCRNGSSVASVEIRTRERDGGHAVVHATVYNGVGYDLGFDDDGDVSIERRS